MSVPPFTVLTPTLPLEQLSCPLRLSPTPPSLLTPPLSLLRDALLLPGYS